jgi:hypothetical protein
MLRKAVLGAVLLGIGATGVASAAGWNDPRRDGRDDRYERRDDRRDDDRRYDNGRYTDQRRRQAPPRYYVPPRVAPRYYNYAPRRAVPYYGWREPYGRGYRYWQNNRYYYVEPGRPAVELRFSLPLR